MTDGTGGSRRLRRMSSPHTGLFSIVAGLAMLTAACSTASTTPQVASLGTSSSDGNGSSAAPGSAGNATRLVDEWAACMRSHGDTGQADPTIDNNGVIQITVPPQGPGGENYSLEAHNSTGPCGSYLQAASKALLGGRASPPPPSLAQLLQYARCMRAHGVPKYPDPNGSGETYIGNLDPNGPVFMNANKVCSKETGTPSGSQPEPPGSIMVGPAAAPSGGVRPSAVPSGAITAGNGGSGANG